MPTMNPMLEEWTLDEVAEALDGVSLATSGVLWGLRNPKGNNTPQGGDGSDGTVETPDGRLGEFDDKMPNNWDKLNEAQQIEINAAAAKLDAYYESFQKLY